MVTSSAADAVANARQTTRNDQGMCLWYTQEWIESPHAYPDASTQWRNAARKHPDDTNPPNGAPVFWTGGSSGYGHAAISVGGGRIRTIDQQSGGTTSEVPLAEITRDWGLPYEGWTEDLGGVDIPWLRDAGGAGSTKGVLGMTEVDRWSRGGDQKLPKDDNWHTLKIDDDDALSLCTGPAIYVVYAGISVSGLPVGVPAQFRFGRVFDYPDDTPTTTEALYPIVEIVGTSGSAFGELTFPNSVGDDAPGDGKERIRLFGNAGSAACTVTGITTRCLHD